ncbi:SRPBCC family protein [Pseudonocardia sp. KRD-184]|uniref:SRPBCC family protein n=1 Tax=Pseudonocardia oceani TaxID=2792013 RepID=A0ABS6U7N7_9PSEU|nr:SRPBCC family protein [Pseudonocardia oceani]MBW0088635.1 SRPBCC family protein [Pseudonocardia oceani]MBW0095545.1 SRPBCC family protein [Pseudonocardia oceani]MBW0111516.1 SRPBCC family protein [Pseudonocardia oceani]MBW0121556.1 SRPBCC family protein [Pseudonocardia oceani]MBW0128245.1 SRPBCC family protein [Pseudonocardia oceani]
MQLENKFTIEAPIEKAWVALNTPDMIAPCFPGATLTEYEGESFTGTVKVKLGPISLTYKGKGTYVDRDDAKHTVKIEASGRDSRGNGTANATVTGTMVADGPNKTAVTMVTDMTITGRPAQFGRGVISDVADKIIGQFAACVAKKLAPEVEAPAPTPAAASSSDTAVGTNGAAASGTAASGTAASGPTLSSTPATSGVTATAPAKQFTPMKSEIDAIDLLDTAGSPVLKRLAPVLGGGALLFLIVFLVRRARA